MVPILSNYLDRLFAFPLLLHASGHGTSNSRNQSPQGPPLRGLRASKPGVEIIFRAVGVHGSLISSPRPAMTMDLLAHCHHDLGSATQEMLGEMCANIAACSEYDDLGSIHCADIKMAP